MEKDQIIYQSTRSGHLTATASEAILQGIAPDGGLYVPDHFPEYTDSFEHLANQSYQQVALKIMSMLLTDFTEEELKHCISCAYDSKFDIPQITRLKEAGGAWYLELFHGATIAFKDMALSILPHLMTTAAKKNGVTDEIVILTATSGDTGKAAMAGFADVPGTRIIVFYPKGGVSTIQEKQMVTQPGENVHVVGIRGNFDDAQTAVKKIFADKAIQERMEKSGKRFSSANSINIGRLVPQIVYYFYAYGQLVKEGKIPAGFRINICVPTGNFGNLLAAFYAKMMGLPVENLICASNENRVLTDFFHTGEYNRNREFKLTSSPSMDILVSSNLERLLYMLCGDVKTKDFMAQLSAEGRYDVGAEVHEKIAGQFFAACCDDDATRARIRQVWRDSAYLIDTHTAVAADAIAQYRAQTGDETPAVVVSTASPFKFAADVCAALGAASGNDPLADLSAYCGIPTPAPLSGLDSRPVRFDGVTEKADMRATVDRFLR